MGHLLAEGIGAGQVEKGERMKEREDFKDTEIVCVDCQRLFTFSKGEAAFFWAKGLSEPKRCRDCRKWRKATLEIPREVVDV